ncbi:MAG: glycosyl hydrolase, partial [Gemmatimonadetes bacterium]|nr:glycosyl hydrolase [Gemmatimonadota bacterium]
MVGPYRGGRSTAATGFLDDPDRWVMGVTGGGVWQSTDNGVSWTNLSDGWFGGSVGAVAVPDSDPNVLYVGLGSADIRGNTSHGRGMWKSTDGGGTWSFIGLPEAGQISRIVVHPKDADLVYVAALGHAFGKNPERGIFRSRDGGSTWEHVLAVSDSTGASSLAMNPKNPRELYAGMWRGERKPWAMISGAEDGGVYKSTDGGDTWTQLRGGLPEGVVGKVGVTVSPADPMRVWALIEAEPAGGVYRSDDAGRTWTRTNSNNNLRQRAWYYTHMRADPVDPNTVYALNTSLYRSVDAGVTFEAIPVPHGDVHDLWIHPDHPNRMVVADDGGAQVSVNGGRTWSTYFNQPTAELYDVVVDNAFPYRLYGAQQDNTTISVPAWMSSNTLYPKQHWLNVGGCETGPVALHPDR